MLGHKSYKGSKVLGNKYHLGHSVLGNKIYPHSQPHHTIKSSDEEIPDTNIKVYEPLGIKKISIQRQRSSLERR
jgi:hypothetical protein